MEFLHALLAQAPAAGQQGTGPSILSFMIPVVLIGLIFWFLIFRPERKKQKQRQEMIESIGKNDKVVTIGGMHGIVRSITDHEMVLLVDEKTGTQIKFNRSAIAVKVTGDEAKGELDTTPR